MYKFSLVLICILAISCNRTAQTTQSASEVSGDDTIQVTYDSLVEIYNKEIQFSPNNYLIRRLDEQRYYELKRSTIAKKLHDLETKIQDERQDRKQYEDEMTQLKELPIYDMKRGPNNTFIFRLFTPKRLITLINYYKIGEMSSSDSIKLISLDYKHIDTLYQYIPLKEKERYMSNDEGLKFYWLLNHAHYSGMLMEDMPGLDGIDDWMIMEDLHIDEHGQVFGYHKIYFNNFNGSLEEIGNYLLMLSSD